MCHIIYFPKSCWNQAITLKDILENIPKPLGEKPEWLAPRGHNGPFENNGRVVKLACESQLALWNHTWSLHPMHLASLQRAMAIWAAVFFLRLHGEKVSQWSRSKMLSPLGWPINLGILKSAFYWAITCSAGLWNFDWIPLGWPINLGILKSAFYWAITCSAGLWNFDWIFSCHRVMLKKGNLEKEAQGYVHNWNAFLRK